MRSIPAALQAKLNCGVTTLARCWKLTRRDGAVFGFGVLVAGMMTFSALQLLRQEKKLPGTREAAPVAGAEPA